MKKLFLLVIVLMLTKAAVAAEITKFENGYHVTTPAYTMNISNSGVISSFKIYGEEMLDANAGDIPYGGYMQDNNGLIIASDIVASGYGVTALSDKARIRYEFADEKITFIATNISVEKFNYSLVPNAAVFRGGDNQYIKIPQKRDLLRRAAFFGKNVNFVADGFNYTQGLGYSWGVGTSNRQVVELNVEPGTTATMIVEVRKTTLKEQTEVDKLLLLADKLFDDLNIYSPSNYQVFQRKSRYEGKIIISGCVDKSYDKLEVRFSGKPLVSDLPTNWRNITFNQVTGAFYEEIILPAGGWYKADFRAILNGKEVAFETIDHFGVGEMFVAAGQSNATNLAHYQIDQESHMVAVFDGGNWRLACGPVPGTHDPYDRGNYYPAFGDAMYASYKVPVGIAAVGHGGTEVMDWLPDSEIVGGEYNPTRLYDWMLSRINQLGKGGFRAVLWHQGESQLNTSSEDTYNGMVRLIRSSTKDAGWYFPWFTAKATYLNEDHAKWEPTRSAQQKLWDNDVALEGPDTDTLTGDMRDYTGAHFSPKGLKTHGEMWADYVSRYLDKVLDE